MHVHCTRFISVQIVGGNSFCDRLIFSSFHPLTMKMIHVLPIRPLIAIGFVMFCLSTAMSYAEEGVGIISENDSLTERYRVVWVQDPTTTATVAWNQIKGDPGVVHYGKVDQKRKHHLYDSVQTPQRVEDYDKMTHCFARLSGLDPDTEYFFCIKDEAGVSRRLKFTTAPDQPKPFTFASGGDSRNFRDARVKANQICRELRPLFIAFTGDMISSDNAAHWEGWLDDWQQTIGKDGNIIPIVPHRGNHEKRPESIYHYFDTPKDAYFVFNIGGEMFRYYTLNSEIPADGAQGKWLADDLAQHRGKVVHLVAGYHKPMRPHVAAKSEGTNPLMWASTFYKNGLDLAIESDSHVVKRTQPLKPDPEGAEGFSAALNDPNATVFIGEGCWGAPLRAADDAKPWTIDCGSFNSFDWIQVSPEQIEVKTIQVSETKGLERVSDADSFKTPKGLVLWQPEGGEILVIDGDK